MKRSKKSLKSILSGLLTINDTPRNIALGYALGIFLSTTPFIGLKAFISIGITWYTKWNKTASLIGVFHINGLNGAAFYGLVYFIGNLVIPASGGPAFSGPVPFCTFLGFFPGGGEIFLTLLIGGFIIGIPASLIAYHVLLNALKHRASAKEASAVEPALSL